MDVSILSGPRKRRCGTFLVRRKSFQTSKNPKTYFWICSYIQKTTHNLIETFKTSLYSQKLINNTNIHIIFESFIFPKFIFYVKNKFGKKKQHCILVFYIIIHICWGPHSLNSFCPYKRPTSYIHLYDTIKLDG